MSRPLWITLALAACTSPGEGGSPVDAFADGAGLRIGDAGQWVGFRELAGREAFADDCVARGVNGACWDGLAWDGGDLVGWWRPHTRGWEQGWTVHAARSSTLRLGVELPDAELVDLLPDRAAWVDAEGQAWTYDGLAAWDAEGRPVSARLEAARGGLEVVVSLRGATLPVTVDPIVGVPLALSSYAGITRSLAAGDFDGDGDEDAVWTDATLDLRWSLGATPAGPDATHDGAIAVPGAAFTSADTAIAAGDLDGDGLAEVVVGAKFRAAGAFGNSGGVVVWPGLATGPGGATLELQSVQTNGQVGASVAVIPDVNQDGYDDLAVGAPGVAGGNGRTYLVLGGAPLSLSYDAWRDGGSFAAHGQHVSGGDLDGDGVGELIASANERVFFYDYNGTTSLVEQTPYYFPPVGTSSLFGKVVTLCDLNGDGYDDLVVGAPGTTGQVGHVHGFLGGPSRPTSPYLTIAGVVTSGEFGYDLACIGDSNGDGREDLAVGEPGQQTNRGRVYWFYSPSTTTTTWTTANAVNWATGTSGGEYRGRHVTSGDVDGNGTPDILFGGDSTNRLFWYKNSDDGDGDGVPRAEDCDDADPAVGAPVALAYEDLDGDGVGGVGRTFCPGEPSVASGGDCDDADPARYPGAAEVCDGDDEDCDADVDEGLPTADWYLDGDGDGWGAGASAGRSCAAPGPGYADQGGDCDDGVAGVSPGAAEVCDGDDEDCDGGVDEGLPAVLGFTDGDGDGWGAGAGLPGTCSAAPAGTVAQAGDCDDGAAGVNPGAVEVCDGVDQDCVGGADDGLATVVVYADGDGDGYGVGAGAATCAGVGLGEAMVGGDCDDGAAGVNPGAVEVCDGADQDCVGGADDGLATVVVYPDGDGDGYGVGAGAATCAGVGLGEATVGGDCDDGAAGVNPGAVEVLDDAVDDDCDGTAQASEETDVPDDTDAPETDTPDDTDPVDTDPADTDAPDTDPPVDTDEGDDSDETDDVKVGCGCDATPTSRSGLVAVGLALLLRRRRRA
jgi:MYXO-CTERM domain-containing protein